MHRTLPCLAISLLAAAFATTVAIAGDYDGLTVSAMTNIEGMAGPANTAMLLSPDGTRLLHIDSSSTCLYEMTAAEPQELSCGEMPGHPTAPEDMFWSPDHAALLWPSYSFAFQHFGDTDVETLDPATMALTNLTDDGFDGSLGKGKAELDTAAQWLDAKTIIFVRHSVPADRAAPKPAALMSMKLGAEPQKLAQLTDGQGLVTAMAVNADATAAAYVLDDSNAPDRAGVYLLQPIGGTPRRLAADADLGGSPSGLKFSADGKYLAALGLNPDGIDATLFEIATGTATRLFADQNVIGVAWSPTGSALAYVVHDRTPGGAQGLYLADPPASPGRLLHDGTFMPPVCCGRQAIVWASNDTMVLGNTKEMNRPYLLRFTR